jgi:hypothetical protein
VEGTGFVLQPFTYRCRCCSDSRLPLESFTGQKLTDVLQTGDQCFRGETTVIADFVLGVDTLIYV